MKLHKVQPILMIDDEYSDIRDLDSLLEDIELEIYKHNQKIDPNYEDTRVRLREYCANPTDAMNQLIATKKIGDRYAAIISDNHMKDENGEGLSGDDFLRVITGNPIYAITHQADDLDISLDEIAETDTIREMLEYGGARVDEDDEILEFLEDFFEHPINYYSFVKYYFKSQENEPKLFMLCGNPREAQLEGLEDRVIPIQKCGISLKGKSKKYCERMVIDYLIEYGIIPKQFAEDAYNNHHRLGTHAHPNHKTFKDPSKKVTRLKIIK